MVPHFFKTIGRKRAACVKECVLRCRKPVSASLTLRVGAPTRLVSEGATRTIASVCAPNPKRVSDGRQGGGGGGGVFLQSKSVPVFCFGPWISRRSRARWGWRRERGYHRVLVWDDGLAGESVNPTGQQALNVGTITVPAVLAPGPCFATGALMLGFPKTG